MALKHLLRHPGVPRGFRPLRLRNELLAQEHKSLHWALHVTQKMHGLLQPQEACSAEAQNGSKIGAQKPASDSFEQEKSSHNGERIHLSPIAEGPPNQSPSREPGRHVINDVRTIEEAYGSAASDDSDQATFDCASIFRFFSRRVKRTFRSRKKQPETACGLDTCQTCGRRSKHMALLP